MSILKNFEEPNIANFEKKYNEKDQLMALNFFLFLPFDFKNKKRGTAAIFMVNLVSTPSYKNRKTLKVGQ